ncbi:glycosyltransferase family 4 protein [Chitinophaga agrisoli]|uniref:Glycosyltransferase family 4 protein n=1 Tax=Chitinophaga agrisoli TaxID=2607653 RepID=A0A5B2VJD3_9BACT|nr:glycosyltransferase family 4 protein [Chitinophaga agrisoli]KAA2239151.1 glycosyltransferase family 4 protein [Chitinophaga agrisoli]
MNTTIKKKAALIELGGSHAECLYAQISFLHHAQYEVHVICNRHLWPLLERMEGITGHQLHDIDASSKSRMRAVRAIKTYLRQHGIQRAVINTTEATGIRELALGLLFRKISLTGLVHNARKLNKGFTLRKLTGLKMKKFFVLNDAQLPHIHPPKGATVRSFYPAFFPQPGPLPAGEGPAPKAPGECWVCIPGSIELGRRDYPALLDQLEKQGLPANMKLIFLGGYDPEQATLRHSNLAMQLGRLPFQDQLVTFAPGLVPQPVFDAWLRQADAILPLLHPGVDKFAEYHTTRISGAYNLSFGYRIPLLMEDSFASWEDLRRHAVFYQAAELVALLHKLAANPALLREKAAGIATDPKFSFETQCQRYLALVEQ